MTAARPLPLLAKTAALALLLAAAAPAAGQGRSAGGFDHTLPAVASGEETSAQSDLWVMRVDFKPMRLVRLPVTDPETGETARELVWYLVWRAANRPLRTPDRQDLTAPVNELDDPPGPRQFVPEFVLIGEDGSARQYQDVILPTALPLIERRELRGEFSDIELNTTVSAAGDLPPLVEGDLRPEDYVYGVATWTGVDPETDRFTVLLNGFSNGYERATGPDGEPVIERRTGLLRFWRPGDAVDENEREFRVGVDPRAESGPLAGLPQWDYLPDEAVDSDGVGDAGANVADEAAADGTVLPEADGGFEN